MKYNSPQEGERMTFEQYLQEQHAKQYTGLDDGMPDDYNDWIDALSMDEWIELGDKFSSLARTEERENIRELVAKDRPMFLRNNIVELMQLEYVKKVRAQLRKEILADIDALTRQEKT